MKKYKLIKKYPGIRKSVPEGSIFKEDVGLESYSFLEPEGYFCVPSWEVVDQPEFWEEVIEKDYEILTIKSDYGFNIGIFKVKEFDLQKGAYLKGPQADKFNIARDTISYILNNFKIHSVKRLSDGEVFTIGDKVRYKEGCSYGYFVISEFFLRRDGKILLQNDNKHICELLNDVEKLSEVAFTTEDGVDIHEGDTYFFIGTDDFIWKNKVYKRWAENNDLNEFKRFSTEQAAKYYIKYKKVLFTTEDGADVYKGDVVYSVHQPTLKQVNCSKNYIGDDPYLSYFSTKEAAQKYIDENKLKYSIKDIREAVDKVGHLGTKQTINGTEPIVLLTTEDLFKQLDILKNGSR